MSQIRYLLDEKYCIWFIFLFFITLNFLGAILFLYLYCGKTK